MVCKMCIFQFIHNEYHCIWKTIVQITLTIRIDISCDCVSVCTSGEFILSYLRYEHWLQLVSVNIISFIYNPVLYTITFTTRVIKTWLYQPTSLCHHSAPLYIVGCDLKIIKYQ